MASASSGASAEGYASRSAAVCRQQASADSSAYVASVPRPRASRDDLSACHAQLQVYAHISITIYIYIYIYIYIGFCVCVCVCVCVCMYDIYVCMICMYV
jgi:hypothetical protein